MATIITTLALSLALCSAPCDTVWENHPASTGMCFNTVNVEEECAYRDAWCVRYTDLDANCEGLVIHLTKRSYHAVRNAMERGEAMLGTLKENCECNGAKVFEIVWEADCTNINTCSYSREYEAAMRALADIKNRNK